jgi:hypothetical protein
MIRLILFVALLLLLQLGQAFAPEYTDQPKRKGGNNRMTVDREFIEIVCDGDLYAVTVRELVTVEAMEERYEAQIREGEAVR